MGASVILEAVTAALNTTTSVIKAQAANLAGQLSLNQQAIDYHQKTDYALYQQALGAQSQRTVIVAVLVIGIVLFLLMVLYMK